MISDPRFQPMDLEQIHADIRKLMAETMRVSAQVSKPSRKSEQFMMIIVVAFSSTVGAATGVLLAVFLK